VERLSRIGMDTSKHIFQLRVDAAERVILRRIGARRFWYFGRVEPTVIELEACGGALGARAQPIASAQARRTRHRLGLMN
jgi:hypothetical protein